MVQLILHYVIDQAIIAGRLKKDVDKKVIVVFPALSQRDLLSLSTSLSSVASALVLAMDSKMLTSDEATKHLKFVLNLLGGDMSIPAADGEPSEGVTKEVDAFADMEQRLNEMVLKIKGGK